MSESISTLDELKLALVIANSIPECQRTNDRIIDWLNSLPPHVVKALIESKPNIWSPQWHKVMSCSAFARDQLLKPCNALILELLPDINQRWYANDYSSALKSYIGDLTTIDKTIDKHLRLWRNAMMVRSIWRDLNRIVATLETTEEITHMADVAVSFALDYHYCALAKLKGGPISADGKVQPMLILGMGKLGAYELNLSSDIDLIFAYPESGETSPSPINGKSISNQEFFTELGQRVIKLLDSQTADGFVFRVDMRLRPYGQSGPLVSNFDSLENYYHSQGRDWERYAMVKARVMSISNHPLICKNYQRLCGQELLALLRSFTYRRYVDYSAIEALRDLKNRIRQEIKRRRLKQNVKLGEGGIREIEFIIQSQQLIRGGREKQLQTPSLEIALGELVKLTALPSQVAAQLMTSYCFLRDAEHAIQCWQDKQTQDLPNDSAGQWALANAMSFSTWEAFNSKLLEHMRFVSQQFAQVIADSHDNIQTDTKAIWRAAWNERHETVLTELLEHQNFDLPKHSASNLMGLHSAHQIIAMDKTGAERLGKFMPILLEKLSIRKNAAQTLQRLQPFIIAVARRSAYILLLIENPNALEQLLLLSEASPWIPERLSTHPALLDELLSPKNLYQPPNKAELNAELRMTMLRIPEDDLEQQMEALRYFRQAHSLQVAACEVTDQMPLMRVSDYLTELAEVILEYTLMLAWRMMVVSHGVPGGQKSDQPNFIVVGYGKLGGIELGHSSDLDLVFIHNADGLKETLAEAGQRKIDNHSFYTRLGQKMIHLLNTNTPSGILYEVDMRLRPSGNSGMLVTTLSAFEKYQLDSAWTWEHQALVRTRVVAGNSELSEAFSNVRHNILSRQRDNGKLKTEVTEMRQKMQKQLGSTTKQKEAGEFHLKQDSGGIVDIEFMVQYAVLAQAHSNPSLTRFSDNIRLLGCLENCGLLSAQEAAELIEAYKVFRATMHRLALQQQSVRVAGHQFQAQRNKVIALWQKLLH